jgi:hypothetical protein
MERPVLDQLGKGDAEPQSPATMELFSQTIMSVELVQYHVKKD